LGHIGEHRVASIANQHDAVLAPSRQWVAFHQRPFADFGTGIQDDARVRMKADKRRAQLAEVSLGRPGFDLEVGLGRTGDKVKLVRARIDLVAHDVAVPTPPFDAGVDLAVEKVSAFDGTVGALPGKTRHPATNATPWRRGVDAIRPNHCIRANYAPTRECEDESPGLPIEPHELLVE